MPSSPQSPSHSHLPPSWAALQAVHCVLSSHRILPSALCAEPGNAGSPQMFSREPRRRDCALVTPLLQRRTLRPREVKVWPISHTAIKHRVSTQTHITRTQSPSPLYTQRGSQALCPGPGDRGQCTAAVRGQAAFGSASQAQVLNSTAAAA